MVKNNQCNYHKTYSTTIVNEQKYEEIGLVSGITIQSFQKFRVTKIPPIFSKLFCWIYRNKHGGRLLLSLFSVWKREKREKREIFANPEFPEKAQIRSFKKRDLSFRITRKLVHCRYKWN